MQLVSTRAGARLALVGLLLTCLAALVSALPSGDIRQSGRRAQRSSSTAPRFSSYRRQSNETTGTVSDDGNLLRLTTLNQSSFTAQPYVANGYIGARLPAAGVGYQVFEANESDPELGGQGWPLFGPRVTASIVAGFYDVQDSTLGTNFAQNGGEQVISLLPSWPSLYVTLRRNQTSSTRARRKRQEDAGDDDEDEQSESSEATYLPGFDVADIRSWNQSMSIYDGVVTTQVEWAPAALGNLSQPVSLRYTVLAHRSRPTLGLIRVDVGNVPEGYDLLVSDVLDGRAAQRTSGAQAGNADDGSDTIYYRLHPNGLPDVTAYVYSRFNHDAEDAVPGPGPQALRDLLVNPDGKLSIAVSRELVGSQDRFTAWKAVGIASTDAFGDAAEEIASGTARDASEESWDSLLGEHREAWSELWNNGGEIQIHGSNSSNELGSTLAKLQTQARASLFHLLTNVRSGDEPRGLGDNSIAPAGLTSDSYAASVFWDAETFMFPPMSLLYPKYAESMLYYRHRRTAQLVANAQQFQKPGILNPWVAARYQNCTGIGPCYDYEYHLNNDIAFAHWQYYHQTRNQTFLEELAFPTMRNVSQFWAAQVTERPSDKSQVEVLGERRYETLNLTDPDEFANFRDNGAFTNAGVTLIMLETIKLAEQLGYSLESIGASNWSDVANNLTLLRSPESNIILEYEGFNSSVEIKQADVSLLIYPLEFNNRFPQKQPAPDADLTFYSGATSPDGPGMTYSMYGIARSQLDGTETETLRPNCESYTRLLQAGMPYEREFAQFSEQVDDNVQTNGGTNPAYTFLTGHGGLLQSYTHGFLGYRARNDTEHVMHIDPNLPPQLARQGGISVRGVRHGQSIVDVDIRGDGTTVTHRSGQGQLLVQAGPSGQGQRQSVAVGESISFATRTLESMLQRVSNNMTNFALCQPVSSSLSSSSQGSRGTSTASSVHAGTNFEQGANDGSIDTYFQPSTEEPTSVIIDLGQTRTLRNITLNWGTIPPREVSIALSSSRSSADSMQSEQRSLIDRQAVEVADPLPEPPAGIIPLPSTYNMTSIDLGNDTALSADDRRGRYLNITMFGAAEPQDKGYGGTLVEVEVR